MNSKDFSPEEFEALRAFREQVDRGERNEELEALLVPQPQEEMREQDMTRAMQDLEAIEEYVDQREQRRRGEYLQQELDRAKSEATLVESKIPLLKAAGVWPLGIAERMMEEQEPILGHKPFRIKPIRDGEILELPDEVLAIVEERLARCEEQGIMLTWFMYAEEIIERPRFVREGYLRAEEERRRKESSAYLDPLLLAVLPLGANRGLWVCVARWNHPLYPQ